MDDDKIDAKVLKKAFAEFKDRFEELLEVGLAHYTSTYVLKSAIETGRVWLRNTRVLNDYNEIRHGIMLFQSYLESSAGEKFKTLLNEIKENFSNEFDDVLTFTFNLTLNKTYILCLSEHKNTDIYGRLSMWRAYAPSDGVAIVLNSHLVQTNVLKAGMDLLPVVYADEDKFVKIMNDVTTAIDIFKTDLKSLSLPEFKMIIFRILANIFVITKHKSFEEEREWRIIHVENSNVNPFIEYEFENTRGILQKVTKFNFMNNAFDNSIDQLINSIFIGPSAYSDVIANSINELMLPFNFSPTKIIETRIPLR